MQGDFTNLAENSCRDSELAWQKHRQPSIGNRILAGQMGDTFLNTLDVKWKPQKVLTLEVTGCPIFIFFYIS